jgi:hypothetical protein
MIKNFVSDSKRFIPEPDLKLLIDFLRCSILPDVEFQAVYEAVMGSLAIQNRLFKALTEKKDSTVNVRISRKPRTIVLKFSALPEFLVSEAFLEAEQRKLRNLNRREALKPDLAGDNLGHVENIESVSLQTQTIEPSVTNPLPTRKGRGKAKKQAPARSPVTVLIDDVQIEKLNALAVEKDVTVSYLIRRAVVRLLQST